jgi:hypothetical protein
MSTVGLCLVSPSNARKADDQTTSSARHQPGAPDIRRSDIFCPGHHRPRVRPSQPNRESALWWIHVVSLGAWLANPASDFASEPGRGVGTPVLLPTLVPAICRH